MNKFLGLFLFVALGLASAASIASEGSERQILHSKNAVLTFCPQGVSECGGAGILIDGKRYSATGATPEINQRLEYIIGSYVFQNVQKTLPFEVSGYLEVVTKTQGGWGPSGQVVFFVITSGLENVPLLR